MRLHRIFLPYGVTVAHLILVQLVWVRILVGQQKRHSNECLFCCLFRFLYTCQRHGALKGAGLPLVTKNMHDEASAFFGCFSVFYIRAPKKQALLTQDLPIMKFNPLRGFQTDSPNHRITKSPINYNSWIEVAAVPF